MSHILCPNKAIQNLHIGQCCYIVGFIALERSLSCQTKIDQADLNCAIIYIAMKKKSIIMLFDHQHQYHYRQNEAPNCPILYLRDTLVYICDAEILTQSASIVHRNGMYT
jgi:hypothetical protein